MQTTRKLGSWRSFLAMGENVLGGLFLFALAFIPIIEIILRRITGSGLVWSPGFLQHAVIWVAWLGGMSASREAAHLSLSSSGNPGNHIDYIAFIIRSITATAINTAFAIASISFIIMGFTPDEKIGMLPTRLILVILPIGYAVMAVRVFTCRRKKSPLYLALGLLIGLILSWPALVNFLSIVLEEISSIFYDSVDFWYNAFSFLRWPLIIILLLLGLRGLPIFILLGGTALLLFSGNWGALESLPNEAYNLLTGNMIPAIPLFTIAGFLLSESSSGKRLVRFFKASLGWLPGGLSAVAVISCAYFTTFTGASGVTILALGGLLATVLMESGHYRENFSKGLVTSSGSIGLLFPPALPIIMYGVTAQVSILDMFLGGILPGILLVLVLSGMGVMQAISVRRKRTVFSIKEFASAAKNAAGDLLLPVVLLTSYFGGLTNVVETAALAVVYTLLLIALTKELNRDLMDKVLRRGMPVIGGVLVILAAAKGLSYYIVDAQVPTMLTAFFRNHISSKFVFLILLNITLLIVGTLMDIYSAILVVAPLIIPLGELYGVHPVQLGIIFLANLQLGYLTPPVGMNLFLASYTFEEPLSRVYRQVLPFLAVLLVCVLVITYVPWFSLSLIQ